MNISLIIIIIVVVIWVQLAFFLKTLAGVKALKLMYPSVSVLGIKVEHGTQVISVHGKVSREFASIVDSTNAYLKENLGAVDFHIIQNLSEQVASSKESEAASGISTPLYIGLMGTFMGVGVGLFSLNVMGIFSDEGINSFLWGVVIAMVASFLGMLLSTVAHYRLSTAIKHKDIRKSRYYSFVQTKLLPGMGSNIIDALGRLKGTLDNFNTVFSGNIDNINSTVVNLAQNLQTIANGMGTQKEILNELYSSKYHSLIKMNMNAFERVEKLLPAMDDFIHKQKMLNEMMTNSGEFVNTMHRLLDRVSTFEKSINELGESIGESQLLGNRQLTLVQKHLEDLDQKQALVEKYTNQSNEVVEEYLKANVKNVRSLVAEFEIALRNAFEITSTDSPFQKLADLETISRDVKLLSEIQAAGKQREEELVNLLASIRNEIKAIRQGDLYIGDLPEGDSET